MPAARLDNTTTISAWPVAVRSASISSKTGISSLAAPIALSGNVICDRQLSSFCRIGVNETDRRGHDHGAEHEPDKSKRCNAAEQADEHEQAVHFGTAGQQHRPQKLVDQA